MLYRLSYFPTIRKFRMVRSSPDDLDILRPRGTARIGDAMFAVALASNAAPGIRHEAETRRLDLLVAIGAAFTAGEGDYRGHFAFDGAARRG